jgi:succinate dehydrogenase/fumarate reductase flavoprotein subunit
MAREESRGAHWREDFPQTAKDGVRSFMTLSDAAHITETAPALQRARR